MSVTKIDNAAEVISSTITKEQILQQLGEIHNILKFSGHENVVIEYGWGCNLGYEELWIPIPIKIDMLMEEISKSKAEGVFVPGSCDLFLRDLVGSFEIKFCHESDIHLSTNNPNLLELISKEWKSHSIEWTTPKKSRRQIETRKSAMHSKAASAIDIT